MEYIRRRHCRVEETLKIPKSLCPSLPTLPNSLSHPHLASLLKLPGPCGPVSGKEQPIKARRKNNQTSISEIVANVYGFSHYWWGRKAFSRAFHTHPSDSVCIQQNTGDCPARFSAASRRGWDKCPEACTLNYPKGKAEWEPAGGMREPPLGLGTGAQALSLPHPKGGRDCSCLVKPVGLIPGHKISI
jgi:hypothetical protein